MKQTTSSNQMLYLLVGAIALLLVGMWVGQFFPQRHPANPGAPIRLPQPIEPGTPGRACTMEAKICDDGTAVGRSGANCEFAPCPGETQGTTSTSCAVKNLAILNPMSGQKATFPLVVRGILDNTANPSCSWTVFEGQAAAMILYDAQDRVVGEGLLMAEGEWMTEGPIAVRGTVVLTREVTPNQILTLLIREDDPSGLTEPQKIEVKLAY